MKRWMALLLAAALCFSLAACSGDKGGEAKEEESGPMTKEELAEAAEEKSFPDLDTTNKAKLETYVGEVYKISGYINSIESDYLVLQEEGLPKKEGQTIKAAKFCIHVYLDTETLAGLSEWDQITVVGEVTDTGTETLEAFPTTYDRLYIDMGNAYIA